MAPTPFEVWFREFPAKFAPFQSAEVRKGDAVYYHTLELDHTRAAEQNRTVEATLATTAVVHRRGYSEQLQIDEASVNLERCADGGLPLLWSHDPTIQIGRAENVRVYEGKLRARLRFSSSARGEEVWKDVKAGIVRGISIGYCVEEYTYLNDEQARAHPLGGIEQYPGASMTWTPPESLQRFGYEPLEHENVLVTRWTPLEASCVAIPADISAGIERALDQGVVREMPAKFVILGLQARLHERYSQLVKDYPQVTEAEEFRGRLKDIQGRMLTVRTEAEAEACIDAIRSVVVDCWVAEDDGEEVSTIRDAFPNTPTFHDSRSVPMEQFSLCRALALTFDPETIRAGGPERDIMQQTANRLGKGRGDRHTLPEEALFRSVTKGGDGANLIGMTHSPELFIEALRSRMITGRLGAYMIPGLTSDIQIPRKTADSSAAWLAGDGSDQVTPSDPSFDKITMKPTSVGCSSTISRKMLLQGDPASERIVRESLAFAVAKAIDIAAINGSGVSNQPKGILNQTGVASTTYTNGGSPSFGDVVDLEKELMVDDADMGNLGYVTTGALTATLKQTEIVSTTGQMIWTATGEGEGRMNGYRAITSNLMPAGYVLFGNWNDLVIATWSGLDFVVDPYTRASYGDVVITVFMDVDIAVRHGESFAEIHEAAP